MTTTTTPTIDLLTLLHQYETLHSSGDENLKSSIWNITTARRSRGRSFGEYSVDDVREELRASALLEWKTCDGGDDDGEPKLVDEEASSDDVKTNCNGGGEPSVSGGRYVLHFDGMKEARQAASKQSSQDENVATKAADNKENEGLRRRRGGNNTAESNEDDATSKWSSEMPKDTSDVDEEEKLRNADPLNLFGVPPPALRVAQAKSRSAVAYYVEVANLAREIMRITNENKL